MNRIDQLFQKKKQNIFSVYFTAGHPGLNDTVPIIKALELQGVDMIEIGMPFSDPMADGPVIQQSSQKALNNGMSLKVLFEQLKDIRKSVSIPLVLMGYLNPVQRYGIENFCKKCNEVGIDGLILPDLPLVEYEEQYLEVFKQNNVYPIFLVTPQTSEDRIKEIDRLSKGFVYMVSSFSTTGSGKGLEQSQEYFKRMKTMNLNNPKVIGFGIKDKQTFQNACQYANGAIIGTSFVKALEEKGTIDEKVKKFVGEIIS
jgi:tryptophan synthase alpha chain